MSDDGHGRYDYVDEKICDQCGEEMLLCYGDDDVPASAYFQCEVCGPEDE